MSFMINEEMTVMKPMVVVGDILIFYRYKRHFTVSIRIGIEILKEFGSIH